MCLKSLKVGLEITEHCQDTSAMSNIQLTDRKSVSPRVPCVDCGPFQTATCPLEAGGSVRHRLARVEAAAALAPRAGPPPPLVHKY
jgi:hypothetical protein